MSSRIKLAEILPDIESDNTRPHPDCAVAEIGGRGFAGERTLKTQSEAQMPFLLKPKGNRDHDRRNRRNAAAKA